MTLSILFWVIMILWLVLSFYLGRPPAGQPYPFNLWGGNIVLFILLVILGWAALGPPVINNGSGPTYYQRSR